MQRLPGSPGADYLANRGIIATSCTAFGLGYVPSVQITEKHGGEWTVVENLGSAIVIPWQANGVIKAVQYRLIEHPTRRFHQKYGSDRTLYGIDRLADPPVLFMVEGELNAVSIWQAAGDLVDVVSFGPEGNIEKAAPYMRAVARKYQHVVVWADKPEKALFAKQAVGRESMPLQSPAGLDANDLLQRGQLAEFVTKVMDKIGAATSIPSSRPNEAVTVIYPADAHCATVHSKWQRLDDGRIEASYTPAELLWAKVATGYEPTAEELAHMAEL